MCQIALWLNVYQIGAYALVVEQERFLGTALIALSFFSPRFSVQNGRFVAARGALFGVPARLPVAVFFRGYYILLGAWHARTPMLPHRRALVCLTCIVPLCLLGARSHSEMQAFLVRVGGLFELTFLTGIVPESFRISSVAFEPSTQDCLVALAVSTLACFARDTQRALCAPRQT